MKAASYVRTRDHPLITGLVQWSTSGQLDRAGPCKSAETESKDPILDRIARARISLGMVKTTPVNGYAGLPGTSSPSPKGRRGGRRRWSRYNLKVLRPGRSGTGKSRTITVKVFHLTRNAPVRVYKYAGGGPAAGPGPGRRPASLARLGPARDAAGAARDLNRP